MQIIRISIACRSAETVGRRRNKKSSTTVKVKGNVKASARKRKTDDSNPSKSHSSSNLEKETGPNLLIKSRYNDIPSAEYGEDGRITMSGIEIIENPPGQYKSRPLLVSYTCSLCKKAFTKLKATRVHIRDFHLPEYRKCVQCGKELKNRLSLLLHIKQTHTPDALALVNCPVCGKPVKDPRRTGTTMKSHMFTHLSAEERKDPKYRNYCYKNKLKLIEESGDSSSTHMCTFCGKSFLKAHSLKRHELTHTNPQEELPRNKFAKTFQCNRCGKVLFDRRRIWEHQSTCGKERSTYTYPCPKCTVRCSSSRNRAKHMRIVHGIGKYLELRVSCPRCARRFTTETGLAIHRKYCIEGKIAHNLKTGKYRNDYSLCLNTDTQSSSTSSGAVADNSAEAASTAMGKVESENFSWGDAPSHQPQFYP